MMPPENPIRILLVDDHILVRAGLRLLIEAQPHLSVAGEAGTGADALAMAARELPDVIILDLDLSGHSGLDLLEDLIKASRGARVVILTGVRDPEVHRRAVQLGATGLVFKDKAAEVLIKAIEKVHAREVWLDHALTAGVRSEVAHADEQEKADPEAQKILFLTDRERQVVGLVCEGLKNKQIADRLSIREATVRNHLTSILSKLGLSGRFDLALYAYRHHLAKPPV
jgi:DNA-binding NarL/FixJ family response regulator